MKAFPFILSLSLFISCQCEPDASHIRLDMKDEDNRKECKVMLEHFEALKAKALYVLDIAETGIVCMKSLLEQQ